ERSRNCVPVRCCWTEGCSKVARAAAFRACSVGHPSVIRSFRSELVSAMIASPGFEAVALDELSADVLARLIAEQLCSPGHNLAGRRQGRCEGDYSWVDFFDFRCRSQAEIEFTDQL